MLAACRLLVAAFALTLSLSSVASDSVAFAKAKEAAHNAFPGSTFTVEGFAFGDLNQDGLNDLTVLLLMPNQQAEGEKELKIAVLFGKADGSYEHYTTSEDVFPHGRVAADVWIERNSLFLRRARPSGCCSQWFESFQFKMVKSDLVLIGEEFRSFGPDVDINDYGTSANYLTYQTIFWRQVGKKRKEIKKVMPTFDLIKLRSFNYHTYKQLLPAQAQGYIDENFSFKQ